MTQKTIEKKKSTLVQIVNEVDELSEEEKSFVLYWLRAKKNAPVAAEADLTITPNNITVEDIYEERNAARKQDVA